MSQQPRNILIIDDNLDTLKLVKDTLESLSFKCITASSAMEGLEKAAAFKPQLILLDLMLPKMSGFGFMREVKSQEDLKKIPVVIYSALGDREIADEIMDLGAAGYLQKMGGTQELVAMVESYCAS